MLDLLFWIPVGVVVLFVLYMASFGLRLGRTEKTLKRAVELVYKQLNNPPLTPEEQAEVDEFCRRGILQKLEARGKDGKTIVLYRPSDDPILAELST